jgi:cephalosporin hydroxylase
MTELAPLPSWASEGTWQTFENDRFHQWVGPVELQKCQQDLDRYAELIEITQPDVVIETGTRRGGSALWFAQHGLKVITIDRDPDAGREAIQFGPKGIDDITWFAGYGSTDPQTILGVMQLIKPDQRVMVSLDSDHHMPHVIAEISLYADLVTPGCYLIIEDACFDMWPAERARVGGSEIPERGGPLGAIRRCQGWLEGNGFWRDIDLERRSVISHSPAGWWRRGD